VEFTVEPFVDAHPGPHVRAAWAAAEARGLALTNGPFSSETTLDEADVAGVVGDIVSAAFAHGATHLSLQLDRIDDASAR
jgi:hypothetical protein